MTTEKRCPKCGEVKPVEMFYALTRGGYSSRCKPCIRDVQRRRTKPAAAGRTPGPRRPLRRLWAAFAAMDADGA